jgi:mRNA-degrading endonuclease RelE of RelBE toxin-antitoxin system
MACSSQTFAPIRWAKAAAYRQRQRQAAALLAWLVCWKCCLMKNGLKLLYSQELAENPRPRGVERIQGTHGGLRVRVGDYRILYTVDDAQQVATIGLVHHRRDVYQGL